MSHLNAIYVGEFKTCVGLIDEVHATYISSLKFMIMAIFCIAWTVMQTIHAAGEGLVYDRLLHNFSAYTAIVHSVGPLM